MTTLYLKSGKPHFVWDWLELGETFGRLGITGHKVQLSEMQHVWQIDFARENDAFIFKLALGEWIMNDYPAQLAEEKRRIAEAEERRKNYKKPTPEEVEQRKREQLEDAIASYKLGQTTFRLPAPRLADVIAYLDSSKDQHYVTMARYHDSNSDGYMGYADGFEVTIPDTDGAFAFEKHFHKTIASFDSFLGNMGY